MKNLLIGNGVIIQFGGIAYLNSSTVNRALKNIRTGRFPSHLYPKDCADFVEVLHQEHAKVLRGEYDKCVYTAYDRSSLEDFKQRYRIDHSYTVEEIGFEDYFLLFELVYNKQNIGNPERFNCRGVIKRMFLDAVYHNGQIENVHQNFPSHFIEWLKEYDQLFTTNYDSNIETASGKEVFHLHGSFRTLSETYDPSSFRNQLKDDLLDGEKVDSNFLYLYSNCLVSYVGELKSSSMTQSFQANNGMEKFAKAYKNDSAIRKQIDHWGNNSNELVRRLKEAIQLKVNNPKLKHSEQYYQDKLEQITGSLDIVGLSPNNDGHLFKQILASDKISKILFYYFDQKEVKDAERLFHLKALETKNVQELWAKM